MSTSAAFRARIRRDLTAALADIQPQPRIPPWLTPRDPDPCVFGPRYPGSRGEYRGLGLRHTPGVLMLCHPCGVTWIGWPGDTCWADGCGRKGIPL